jgi:hypothetical protein
LNFFFDDHLQGNDAKTVLTRIEIHGTSDNLVLNAFMVYVEKTEQIRFTLPEANLKPYVTEEGSLKIIMECRNTPGLMLLDGMIKAFIHDTTTWMIEDFDQLDSKGRISHELKDCWGNSFVVWCFKSTASRFSLEVFAVEDKEPMPMVKKDGPVWFKLSLGHEGDIKMETHRVFKDKKTDAVRFAYDWKRVESLVRNNKIPLEIQFGTFPDDLVLTGTCGMKEAGNNS